MHHRAPRISKEPDAAVDHAAHYVIARAPNTQFFHYFGILSDQCWRRHTNVPADACMCEVAQQEVSRAEGLRQKDAGAFALALDRLGLAAQPPPSAVRVGVISRRRKRFVLNEAELVVAMLENMNVEVQLLPLESMTLYEQLAALRATTILVGIHGSGLNNAIFLPKGACVVQLLPFGLNYRGAFQQNAVKASVDYKEWQLADKTRAVFHWEFLGEKELARGKDAILAKGSPKGGELVYTFWINQDLVVPVDEVIAVLRDAIATSPLNRALTGLPPRGPRDRDVVVAKGPPTRLRGAAAGSGWSGRSSPGAK